MFTSREEADKQNERRNLSHYDGSPNSPYPCVLLPISLFPRKSENKFMFFPILQMLSVCKEWRKDELGEVLRSMCTTTRFCRILWCSVTVNFLKLDQCIEGTLHGDFASIGWYDRTEFDYGCCLIHAEISKWILTGPGSFSPERMHRWEMQTER